MTHLKKGSIVYRYNMWTKRFSKVRIINVLKNDRYVIEHPDGRAIGQSWVAGYNLSERKPSKRRKK